MYLNLEELDFLFLLRFVDLLEFDETVSPDVLGADDEELDARTEFFKWLDADEVVASVWSFAVTLVLLSIIIIMNIK